MPNNCLHGMDQRFCSLCNRPSSDHARNSTRSSRTATRAGRPSRLSLELGEGGKELRLSADVSTGWRQLAKVVGFCESQRLTSTRYCDLRVQLKVFPRYGRITEAPPLLEEHASPATKLVWVVEFDEESTAQATRANRLVPQLKPLPVRWNMLPPHTLRLEVDVLNDSGRFNPQLPWKLSPTGAPTMHWIAHFNAWPEGQAPEGRIATAPTEYDLQLLLVARPPDLRRGPVERVWLERHFVPGGLPELGRRC